MPSPWRVSDRRPGSQTVLIAFNKPFGVLSQFTSDGSKPTLADHIDAPDVYPAGRLDFDSEGLLLLTDDGWLQHRIADHDSRLAKRYQVQVEGVPQAAALARFDDGLTIGQGSARYRALPATAIAIDPPRVEARTPPIRYRAAIPTAWIEITLREGKNRQVRRMTAAIGHPTLRLIRVGIGVLDLFELGIGAGEWVSVNPDRLVIASETREPEI